MKCLKALGNFKVCKARVQKVKIKKRSNELFMQVFHDLT